ncbi:MAG TPA: hypothetical protein VGJ56_31360 [Reyranella sp.]|jgi:hypothetical protein
MTTGDVPPPAITFDRLRARDTSNEIRILWSEVGIAALLAVLLACYFIVA